MRPARSIERVLFVLVVVHACTIAVALCRAPYDTLLDEGLQRALLVGAIEAGVNTSQVPEDVYLLGGDDADPDVDHVLTAESFALDVDCGWMLDQWVWLEPSARPPSVVPRSFEQTGMVHARWYLLSSAQGAEQDVYDELIDGNTDYATAAYVFPRLQLFLVHVVTLDQFRRLMNLALNGLVTHVMENYPLRPAWDSARDVIGYPRSPFSSNFGDGYALAVIDTGVDPEHFQGRIVYEACFSSRALLVYGEDHSTRTCEGRPLGSEVETVFEQDVSASEPYYQTSSTTGAGSGAACLMDFQCKHGNQVAYIAAGANSEDTAGKTDTSPAGLAPAANIVSIRVASQAPKAYCEDARRFDQYKGTCVVIFPLDVLRALAHLVDLQTADVPMIPRGRLVAVNLSLHVNIFCDKEVVDSNVDPDVCKTNPDVPHWGPASYANPCAENEFTPLVQHLKDLGTWTVIAAGNQKASEIGKVSLPACVEPALTIAGVREEGRESEDPRRYLLYTTSMFGDLVDFAAPGHQIVTPAGSDTINGTSYAAPQVSGALVLIREQALEHCDFSGEGLMARLMEFERSWLSSHAAPIEIHHHRVPGVEENLIHNGVVLSLEDDAFECSTDAGVH